MNKRFLWAPLGLLALAALACGSGTSNGNGTEAAPALYRDNFSDEGSGWCVDSDADAALSYDSGQYLFEVNDTEWFVWCNPGENFDDVHLEVSVENSGGTGDTAFGLMCHFQEASGDFYYAGVTAAGDYIISLYQNGEDNFLAEGTTDEVDPDAGTYQVGMNCNNGTIALYVNGTKIDSGDDDTYSSGDIGLFAWTVDEAPAEIRYDDIVVTAP